MLQAARFYSSSIFRHSKASLFTVGLRAMSSNPDILINQPKYSWLKELGLQEDNPGVFDGTWHAGGKVRSCMCSPCRILYFTLLKVVTSYSPASALPIARVQEVSLFHSSRSQGTMKPFNLRGRWKSMNRQSVKQQRHGRFGEG